ncbi:MAG: hypothetical protein ACRD1T_11875 [Acidimicrobiia bacterium]
MGEKGTKGAAWIEDSLYKKYLQGKGWERSMDDHRSVFNPETGQNGYYDDEKQQWMDTKTGQPISPSGLAPSKH